MASNIKISTAARNAALSAITSQLANTWVRFYTGAPPDVNAAATGSHLCTIFTVSGWGAPAGGQVNFNSDTDLVLLSGTVGYFRLENYDSTIRLQGTVDIPANTPDWSVSVVNWVADGWIDPFTATFIWPE